MRERGALFGHVGGGLASIGTLGLSARSAARYGVFGAASTSEIDRAQIARFVGQWDTNLSDVVRVARKKFSGTRSCPAFSRSSA